MISGRRDTFGFTRFAHGNRRFTHRAEACHFGFVRHVGPTGTALAKARELAARVAANGPLAVSNAKASTLKSGWLDDEDARKIEQRFVVEVM